MVERFFGVDSDFTKNVMLTMNKDRTKLAFAQEKYYKFKGIIKESHYAMKAKAETKSAWEMAEKKFRIRKISQNY